MKVKFSLLSIEDTASILDWSSKQSSGILPLSEGTFNLYPELKDKLDVNKDNTKLICNIIKDKIEKFNQDNKDVIERYKLLWNKYNDRFIKAMEDILKNLNLWYEIESISHDVWQFMKEKKFEYYLSNGQKQRLILAKILYFLDNDIDALILDEATSGLDSDNNMEIDAQNVLEYIVKFANEDKKRIVVISTHQNLDADSSLITEHMNGELD